MTDVLCGGVLYRQCTVRGVVGMCFNTNLQVIACDFSGMYETMRRLEIARGVGKQCNYTEEAWLGCPEP